MKSGCIRPIPVFFVHCNPITPVAEHFVSRWGDNPCTEHPIRFKPEGILSACWVVGWCYCSYRKLIPVSYITMVLSSFAKLSQNSPTTENDLDPPTVHTHIILMEPLFSTLLVHAPPTVIHLAAAVSSQVKLIVSYCCSCPTFLACLLQSIKQNHQLN